ncbi:MAG: hypothetical protein JWN52_6618 [Actinomycetia bacterium]|nr:hypothetical protein [Actinomycetes bacterium]
MTAELLEVFNRICDEVTALHGEPFLRTAEASDRFREGRQMVTAGWFLLDGVTNHGFKIYECRDGIEILTWAHSGDVAWVKAHLRSWEVAEQTLRRILPPAFGIRLEASTS